MTGKLRTEFEPGRGYSKEDWDDIDSPPLTEEERARARPAREVLPVEFFEAVAEARRKRGRPGSEAPKRQITLRLDADVIDSFKTEGAGWQGRINEALRKARGL